MTRDPVQIELLGCFRVSVGIKAIEDSGWRLVKLLSFTRGHRLRRTLKPDISTGAVHGLSPGDVEVFKCRSPQDPHWIWPEDALKAEDEVPSMSLATLTASACQRSSVAHGVSGSG